MSESGPAIKVCGIRTPEIALAVMHAGADLIGLNFAQVSRRRIAVSTARRIVDSLGQGVSPPSPSGRGAGGEGVPPQLIQATTAHEWREKKAGGAYADNDGVPLQPTDQPRRHVWRKGFGGRDTPYPAVVGIFVEQSADEIAAIASEAKLDAVQLSGECTPEACADVHRATGLPVIAVVRFGDGGDTDQPRRRMRREIATALALATSTGVAAVLVDAPGTVGGAGKGWDHAQARQIVDALEGVGLPVIVAGGLNAGNVFEALRASGAWGADVASGVETDGMTDPGQVRALVRAARAH